MTLIYGFVVINASPEQWEFALDPSRWGQRHKLYFESKLLVTSILIVPAIVAALLIVISPDRRKTVTGALVALALLASAAGLRVLWEQGGELVATDLLTARNALLASPSYSIVSYGLLLAVGSLAAAYFRGGWVASGFLFFVVALLSRRAEAVAVAGAFIGLFAVFSIRDRGIGARGASCLGALVLGGVLVLLFHNEHNQRYFEWMGSGLNVRITMALQAAKSTGAEQSQHNMEDDAQRDWIFGVGLGRYREATQTRFDYPHNLGLELAVEHGAFAMALYVALVGCPLVMIFVSAFRRQISDPELYCTAILLLVIIFCFKASDVSMLGISGFASTLTLLALSGSPQSVGTSLMAR